MRLEEPSNRIRDLSEALIAPTALAAQQTGEVLQTLRMDIDQASLAAERWDAIVGVRAPELATPAGR